MRKVYSIGYYEVEIAEVYETLTKKDIIINQHGRETWDVIYKDLCNTMRKILNINNYIGLLIKKPEHRKDGDYSILIIVFDIEADGSLTIYDAKKEYINETEFRYYLEVE